jgi:hypothetical protein
MGFYARFLQGDAEVMGQLNDNEKLFLRNAASTQFMAAIEDRIKEFARAHLPRFLKDQDPESANQRSLRSNLNLGMWGLMIFPNVPANLAATVLQIILGLGSYPKSAVGNRQFSESGMPTPLARNQDGSFASPALAEMVAVITEEGVTADEFLGLFGFADHCPVILPFGARPQLFEQVLREEEPVLHEQYKAATDMQHRELEQFLRTANMPPGQNREITLILVGKDFHDGGGGGRN